MNTISFRFVLTTSTVFILCFVLVAGNAFAMCGSFVPLNTTLRLDDAANKGLLIYENGMETLVFEPSFTGTAKDFALVLALPNIPIIEEAPKGIFEELNRETIKIIKRRNRFFETTSGFATLSTSGSGSGGGFTPPPVTVLKEKNVGDYKTTILTARTSDGLLEWLEENKYNVKKEILPTLEYYVQKSSYYFVVLKVNFEDFKEVTKNDEGGRLNPIAFTFKSDEPILPVRIMASGTDEENVIEYTLYAISDKPLYIPGTMLWHSDKLQRPHPKAVNLRKRGIDTFERYSLDDKWLTRTHAMIDTSKILQDYILEEGSSRLKVGKRTKAVKVNVFLTPTESGFLPSEKGNNFFFTTGLGPRFWWFGQPS